MAILARLIDHRAMNLRFHSKRLTLSPFTPDDFDLSMAIFTDPAVLRYAGDVMSEQHIRANMSSWSRRGGNGGIGIWTVSDRRTAEKYGSAALLPMPVDEDETDFSLLVAGEMPQCDIEIGYFLKRSAWGFGYATEASRRLLRFAFEETPLEQVVATFHKENLASRNVLLKSGFTDRGTMRCYGKDGGLNFRITRDEWLQQQST